MRANNVKKKNIAVFAAVAAAVLFLWTLWGNTALEVSTYTVFSAKLPESFSGFRIAQVSDLHNAEFGGDNGELLGKLQESEPDIIVITGDLVDYRNTDIAVALRFAEKAMKIAPCYYVTGNHEALMSEYEKLEKGLEEAGVTILRNARIELEYSGENVALIGVDDPGFFADTVIVDDASMMNSVLQKLPIGRPESTDTRKTTTRNPDVYTVLLSHRPELFDVYAENGVDLVFSGHAHGGQLRLPFAGGLVAPNQGFFPEYDAGAYTAGNTTMIVSRGIGNSIIPVRFNNRPEVVIAELRTAD